MKSNTRILALAAPLAAVAFSFGVSPALAEPAGPGLDKIASAEQGPVNPHLPEVDDKTSLPEDPDQPTDPQGPDDKVSIPEPCPTHGSCGDEPDDKKGPGDDDSSTGDEIEKPTRIDAGTATSEADTAGDDLAWLLTGGLLIAMTGTAYVARRRSSKGA